MAALGKIIHLGGKNNNLYVFREACFQKEILPPLQAVLDPKRYVCTSTRMFTVPSRGTEASRGCSELVTVIKAHDFSSGNERVLEWNFKSLIGSAGALFLRSTPKCPCLSWAGLWVLENSKQAEARRVSQEGAVCPSTEGEVKILPRVFCRLICHFNSACLCFGIIMVFTY